jgi:hypothetical protein
MCPFQYRSRVAAEEGNLGEISREIRKYFEVIWPAIRRIFAEDVIVGV